MLPVSVSVLAGLDCPFLIAHSVFSNVYISSQSLGSDRENKKSTKRVKDSLSFEI
jgi:hypothetical protein